MSRFLKVLLAAGLGLTANVASAGERAVVVELFTSQGCSSCPPADALLGEIADREDVIALALHVDYWDYIGWKDEFADPSFTARQRAYARAKGERTIYTPQMVIGGEDHIIGFKAMALAELLAEHSARTEPASVDLKRDGDRVVVTVRSNGGSAQRAVVQVATYLPEATVSIRRGENAGRTLSYHNVVRDLEEIGTWNGRGTFTATVRVNPDYPVVAIVQATGAGPVLGAAKLR